MEVCGCEGSYICVRRVGCEGRCISVRGVRRLDRVDM